MVHGSRGATSSQCSRRAPAARKGARTLSAMVPVTLDDVRELALSLPRSYEAVVRGRDVRVEARRRGVRGLAGIPSGVLRRRID